MLTPNGRDLANDYLVQILERVYLGTLRFLQAGSVCVLCFIRRPMLLAVPNCGAQWGSGAKSTGNHLFNIDAERQSSQSYDWWTCCFVFYHYGNSFADKAILSSHVIMSYLLCCSSLACFMMTQPLPIASKLPIKTLVARQLPTSACTCTLQVAA